jgi:hypothetical protein
MDRPVSLGVNFREEALMSSTLLRSQVFGEERTIAPVGATFKDDFGPYEAHVYIVR